MTEPRTTSFAASPWPRRLALATAACAVPLVFFGGTVTTLHAGLAIDGWLVVEPGRGDHFLWLYPVDKWFQDVGHFVEHTHRMIGSLVGLLALATVVATFLADRRALPRAISCAALLAVIAQGVVGGLRVLEKSEDLAFLHGALGQAVFALLGATAIVTSRAWGAASATPHERGARLRRLAFAATAVVYAQIVVGAWLRHARATTPLVLHGLLVFAVVACVLRLAREMRLAEVGALRGQRRALLAALVFQLALGVLAFVVVYVVNGDATAGLGTSVFPTLHVLGGAALLLACLSASMWALRLFSAAGSASRVEAPRTGDLARGVSVGGAR